MTGRDVRRWIRRVWVAAGLGATAWIIWNAQAHGVPASALASSASVEVGAGDGATLFVPARAAPEKAAFVFLPGGAIDPRAYVPFVRAIAEAGYPAALVRLPFRVAPTEGTREELWRRIEAAHRALGAARPLVLAGHSRGAALSARFTGRHPGAVDALALVATTHPRDEDLSRLTIPVLKILGARDCVAPADDARANAGNLPAHTEWVEIAGANHAQFGHYGSQFNDCRATIARDAQQSAARDAIVAMLAKLDDDAQGGDSGTQPDEGRSQHQKKR